MELVTVSTVHILDVLGVVRRHAALGAGDRLDPRYSTIAPHHEVRCVNRVIERVHDVLADRLAVMPRPWTLADQVLIPDHPHHVNTADTLSRLTLDADEP